MSHGMSHVRRDYDEISVDDPTNPSKLPELDDSQRSEK
jgi:hypothetical protein